MTNLLKRFVANDNGATAIEYGLIAGLIGLVIITGLTAVGTTTNSMLDSVAATLTQ